MIGTPAEFRPVPFLRKAWVSGEARLLHEDRIRRIATAWEMTELRSANSVRPCALASVPSPDYVEWMGRIEALRMTTAALRVLDMTPLGSAEPLFVSEMVVGSRRDVKAFRSAWITGDNKTIGALLGYPACCCAFFCNTLLSGKVREPVWLIGGATPGVQETPLGLSLSGLPETNILLRRLGVRAIPHFPCSFRCEESRSLSREMTALFSSLGYSEEIGWLNEMLDWPIRWSALHSIAEIRTPVIKIATHADPTAQTLTLDWLGQSNPIGAARGLDFPYRKHPMTMVKTF